MFKILLFFPLLTLAFTGMSLSTKLLKHVEKNCLTVPSPSRTGFSAVIDTNVLLDLLFWNDPQSDALQKLILSGEITPVRDRESMLELAEVSARTNFLDSDEKAGGLVQCWCARSAAADENEVSRTKETLKVRCKDPLDQKFLILAVASGAELLITKDKLVLKAGKKLRRYGIACIRPEEIVATVTLLKKGIP